MGSLLHSSKMRFAILGLFVLAHARITRSPARDANQPGNQRKAFKPTPPPKTTYYDPCSELNESDKEKCREESFCRHDKHHRECCTIDYEVYMDWYTGDWMDFMCPDDKLTNTKKEKYCDYDSNDVYCCAKKDVFANNPGFDCHNLNNVDNDKFTHFDEEPHFECKCKDPEMVRAVNFDKGPRDPCKCEEGQDHGEIDWDVIFETEGSFFTTEGSSDAAWENEGSYWENDGSYMESDEFYNETDYINTTGWEEDEWVDWFDITIIEGDGSDYETDINFWDWTVGGEDIVWIEPAPEMEDFNHCLDDIHGERCCNSNEAIIGEWIQEGAEFECPNTSFEQMLEDTLNALGDNLMIVLGIVAAVMGTCCICVCICCCRCCKKKQPHQQQTVIINGAK